MCTNCYINTGTQSFSPRTSWVLCSWVVDELDVTLWLYITLHQLLISQSRILNFTIITWWLVEMHGYVMHKVRIRTIRWLSCAYLRFGLVQQSSNWLCNAWIASIEVHKAWTSYQSLDWPGSVHKWTNIAYPPELNPEKETAVTSITNHANSDYYYMISHC